MNIIQGGGQQIGSAKEEREQGLRHSALGIAIEWARSRGPEHCTHIRPEEFVDAARQIYEFLRDGSSKPGA